MLAVGATLVVTTAVLEAPDLDLETGVPVLEAPDRVETAAAEVPAIGATLVPGANLAAEPAAEVVPDLVEAKRVAAAEPTEPASSLIELDGE